jgi:HEPN domain-containing protein
MQPHEEWLFKAEHDLRSAELLCQSRDPLLDIAIYHTQQCAEKAMKAFLVSQGRMVEKTHNLALLVEQCTAIDGRIGELIDDALFLRPFATLYRYPEGELEPEKVVTEAAIAASRRILGLIAAILKK